MRDKGANLWPERACWGILKPEPRGFCTKTSLGGMLFQHPSYSLFPSHPLSLLPVLGCLGQGREPASGSIHGATEHCRIVWVGATEDRYLFPLPQVAILCPLHLTALTGGLCLTVTCTGRLRS